MDDKIQLRQELKRRRLEISTAERTLMSRLIVDKLKNTVDWSEISAVHYFEPIGELLEPDISGLLTYLEDNYPHIQLFAPRLIGGEWEMVSIQSQNPPKDFDVVIVPMLGFDERLHRIGYGGGYYDKFLANQQKAQKIGVCFELGRLKRLPNENHDIPLNMIVTEDKTYSA